MLRDEILAHLGRALSDEIAAVIREEGTDLQRIVDATIPPGSPGSQFHRPFLLDGLKELLEDDEPLDPLTCLQVCVAMDWEIGIVEVPEED